MMAREFCRGEILIVMLLAATMRCGAAQQPRADIDVVTSQNVENANTSVYLTRPQATFTLNCRVAGISAATEITHYQWLFRNVMSATESDPEVLEPTNSSLSISSVSYQHNLGNYRCKAFTSAGDVLVSSPIMIRAKFAGIFPVDDVFTVRVVNNEPVVLECVVVLPPGETDATIGWLKVDDSGESLVSPHAPGNNVFHISQATRQDSGEYRCQLFTGNSGSQDADIRLLVVTLPQFFHKDDLSLSVVLYDDFDIRCGLIQSESEATFTWRHNDQPLQPNDRISISNDLMLSTLTITGATYAEAGNYECIASNFAGSSSHITTVTVEGPPVLNFPSNHTSFDIPINQEQRLLDCPHLANPPATLVWSKDNQNLILSEKYRIYENGSLHISRLGVNDSGNYTCRISNSEGMEQVTFRLLGIPESPLSLKVTPMDDNVRGAVLSWRTPPEDVNRPLSGYLIHYNLEDELPQEIESAASETEIRLTSLYPGEMYEMSLQAVNIAGFSTPVIARFTLPATAPYMIFNVSTMPDGRSLLTQWELIYDGGPNIEMFTIKVYVEKNVQLLIHSMDADVTSQGLVLSGLEPTTEYVVEVLISNGLYDEIMRFTITTNLAPPGQPSTPEVTLTTTHIFQITFTVEDGSEPITDLVLNTTKVLDNGKSLTDQTLIRIDDHFYVESLTNMSDGRKEVVLVISGLEQLQQYTFEVAAISAVGWGDFSQPSSPDSLGRILYYIVFSVVGGAIVVIIVTIVVAVVMLRTTRRIQRTKRTLSINGSAKIPESFALQSPTTERRRPSLLATNMNECYNSHCTTPVSSVFDYKHHTLSSSTGEPGALYDRLTDFQKASVSSNESDKRNGSISSDGQEAITQTKQIQPVERVIVDMYSSEGRINSAVHNTGNGASAQPYLHSSVGQLQVKSTHSLCQLTQQQVSRQKLPNSLHQLPMFTQKTEMQQHFLCPPKNLMMAGSSPAIHCRRSCDSMLDSFKPTSYMTDV